VSLCGAKEFMQANAVVGTRSLPAYSFMQNSVAALETLVAFWMV